MYTRLPHVPTHTTQPEPHRKAPTSCSLVSSRNMAHRHGFGACKHGRVSGASYLWGGARRSEHLRSSRPSSDAIRRNQAQSDATPSSAPRRNQTQSDVTPSTVGRGERRSEHLRVHLQTQSDAIRLDSIVGPSSQSDTSRRDSIDVPSSQSDAIRRDSIDGGKGGAP